MPLNGIQIDYLVKKGCWNVHADLRPTPGYSTAYGDEVIFAGDGVDDLDRVMGQMTFYPYGIFKVDTGVFDGVYTPVSKTDLLALKDAFIAAYGTVDKPPLYPTL